MKDKEFETKITSMTQVLQLAIDFSYSKLDNETYARVQKVKDYVAQGVTDTDIIRDLVVRYPRYTPVRLPKALDEDSDAMNDLYSIAIHSVYHMDILTACYESDREYKDIRRLLNYADRNEHDASVIDLIPYVMDKAYDDLWLTALFNSETRLLGLKRRGIDLLSFVTPKHSPFGFRNLCESLFHSGLRGGEIDLSWYRDPYWRNRNAVAYLHLLIKNTDVDYSQFITSATALPVILGVDAQKVTTKDDFDHFVHVYWSDMTPKLEYAINASAQPDTYGDWINAYLQYKEKFDLDGDDLADRLSNEHRFRFPDELFKHVEHYREVNRPDGAVEWIRRNGAKALEKLSDAEVWEIGRQAYYTYNE